MKHVDGALKLDRVNSSVGVCAMVLDHFEDPWSLPSPRFGAWVLSAKLCNAESGSNLIDNPRGESQQVLLVRTGPEQWLLAGDPTRSRHIIIPVLGCRVKGPNFSNILVDKYFRDLLAKGAGNFECQPQVGVKSAPFNGVHRLARHPALRGQFRLGPLSLRAQDAKSGLVRCHLHWLG